MGNPRSFRRNGLPLTVVGGNRYESAEAAWQNALPALERIVMAALVRRGLIPQAAMPAKRDGLAAFEAALDAAESSWEGGDGERC